MNTTQLHISYFLLAIPAFIIVYPFIKIQTKIKSIIYYLLVVPPLFFFTDLTRNPYYFQIALLNILVLVIWLLFLFRIYKEQKIKLYIAPVDVPLLCFFGIAFISFIVALIMKQQYLMPEIIDTGKKMFKFDYLHLSMVSEGTKKLIFTLVNVWLSYWIASNFIDENMFKKVYNVLFAVAVAAAGYGIFQYFGIEWIWPQVLSPFGGRSVSTFGNPNFISSYLLLLCPVILAFIINSKNKVFYIVALLACFGSILCSLTRSTWIGLFAAMSLMVWYLFREKELSKQRLKLVAVLAGIGLLMFLFWPKSTIAGPSTIERIMELKKVINVDKNLPVRATTYGPVHQRQLIWSCAWNMVSEYPLLGRGWGLFELFYPFYQGKYLYLEMLRNFRTHANNAHNEILEVWSQTGTIGFGIYVWFIVCVLFYGKKIIKHYSGEKKIIAIALLCSIVGMVVDNIFGNVSIHFCVPAFLCWWNLGMLVSLDPSRKIYEIKLTKGIKFLTFCIAIFLCFLIFRIYKQFMGEVNYFAGFKYSKRGEIKHAIKFLEKSHKCYPEVNSEYELGNCYARENQIDDSVRAYYQALGANCGYDEIHFNLATIYARKQDFRNAMMNYSESIYINPMSQESYLALGNIFLKNVDVYLENAIKLFEKSVIFYPENMDIWNNLGFLYTKKATPEAVRKAINAYHKALELNPEFELARHNLAQLLKSNNMSDPMLDYGTIMSQVEERISAKDWNKVIPLCKKLISISPKSFKARFYLANTLFTLGQIDESIEEYSKALDIDGNNVYAHTNLGLAYYQKQDYPNARKEFETVLRLDPKNQLARERLNWIGNNLK